MRFFPTTKRKTRRGRVEFRTGVIGTFHGKCSMCRKRIFLRNNTRLENTYYLKVKGLGRKDGDLICMACLCDVGLNTRRALERQEREDEQYRSY